MSNMWADNKVHPSEEGKNFSLRQKQEKIGRSQAAYKTAPLHIRRAKLLQNPVKALRGWAGFKYRRKLGWNKFKISWREFKGRLDLWQSSFKTIEGHFGAGVVSYFIFLKWLWMLNIYIFLIVFTFICVPMIAFPAEENYSKYVTSDIYNSSDATNISFYCSALYTVTVNHTAEAYILDFFQGTGWMERTLLFYGYYANKELGIGNFGGSQYNYNMPLAYLCVTGVFLFLSLILLVRHTAQGFMDSVVNESDKPYQYCNAVFGSWDFSMEDQEGALLAQKSIFHEIMGDLEEEKQLKRRNQRTCCRKFGLWTVRSVINLLVLGMLGGSGYLIYYVQTKMLEIAESDDYVTYDQFVILLIQFAPSLTITILNVIIPLIFNKIVKLEDYMPAFELKFTLARTVLLKLASLTMLIITVYSQVVCSPKESICNVGTTTSCPEIRCWETYIGQQLYKLVVLDFLVMLVTTLLVEFPRKLIISKCVCGMTKLIGLQEFDITKEVLALVYTQTLCWLGTFFSPLIPAIVLFSMIIRFFLRKLSLMINMKASDKPYSASKTNSFFMGILFMAFILTCMPVGYCIGLIAPSKGCGPFRIYKLMTDIVDVVVKDWPATVREIASYIKSPACVFVILTILLLIIYLYSVLNSSHKAMIAVMKDQLVLEGQDKQFLLKRINELEGSSHKKKSISSNGMSNGGGF